MIHSRDALLLAAGGTLLLAAWLPQRLRRRPLSLPIVLVALGALLFSLPVPFTPDHRQHNAWFAGAAEAGVLVSLMGAGLKLDRPLGRRSWATTWRLLAVGMPLTILVITGIGLLIGLPPVTALLLGAVLAPTDPVLAADVQVGEPSTGGGPDILWAEDEVRFSLTSEAGLNDGLAFPFVYAAIALAGSHGHISAVGIVHWLAVDVAYRLVAAIVVGAAVGWLLARLIFDSSRLGKLADTATGFVALAATLLAYGAAELVHSYGFVAVFVAAVAIRSAERSHEYQNVLHDFADEAEQVLVVGLLVLLGGALVNGLLADLDVRGLLAGIACILVARPLACRLALLGRPLARDQRRTIAFFGIRGIGSFYYLAYAASAATFASLGRDWAVVSLTVLASIVVHGVAATPVMARLDRRRARLEASSRRGR